MKKNEGQSSGRVLARVLAVEGHELEPAEFMHVAGGVGTVVVTQTTPTKQDVTNGTSDHD